MGTGTIDTEQRGKEALYFLILSALCLFLKQSSAIVLGWSRGGGLKNFNNPPDHRNHGGGGCGVMSHHAWPEPSQASKILISSKQERNPTVAYECFVL